MAKEKQISSTRAWVYVITGGLLEIVWASGFKYESIPGIIVLASLIASFELIIMAARVLPVGTVYAVFAGMGTLGTTVVEIALSGKAVSPLKIGFILLLLVCIIGLKLTARGGKA